jgi:hypothetical protein
LKEHIKKLLETGSSISVSYKTKIDEWYGSMKICRLYDNELGCYEYIIEPGWKKFVDIDQAVNEYCYYGYTSKNFGYIQNRLNDKGLIDEEENLEKPSKEIKKLFREEGKIVDEESKAFNITTPIKASTNKEVEADFRSIFSKIDIDLLSTELLKFKKKHILSDPYITVDTYYDMTDVLTGRTDSNYNRGMGPKSINREFIETHVKGYKGDDRWKMEFKKMGLTMFLRNKNGNLGDKIFIEIPV